MSDMANKKTPDEETVQINEEIEAAQQEAQQAAESQEEAVQPSEVELLTAELNECKDKHLRLAAEYDNYRKRTAREKDALYGDATAAAVSAFLPVYDNLERALASETQDEAYRKGVEMIFTQLCETMAKLKVEEINPQGEKFDPNLHNAVMHVEDENFEENTVAEVFQKGFKIGDRVVRHAMVKVAN